MWNKALCCLVGLMVFPLTLFAAYPVVVSIGPEEVLGNGRLSYVTMDNLGQPHIACDGGTMAYFYDKIGGKWVSSSVNTANYGSKQWFNPYIEIDNYNNAWASGVLYPIVVGADSGGIGVFVRPNVSTTPGVNYFSRKSFMPRNWDCGNLSFDIFRNEAVIYVTGEYYGRFVGNSTVAGLNGKIAGGTFVVGKGGEAHRINISRAGAVLHSDGTTHGVWHCAITGHVGYDYSKYQNSLRNSKKLPSVVWADPAYYKEMGSDGNYVGVCGDARLPEFAYISTDLNSDGGQGGIYANVFNGTGMVCPVNDILVVDRTGTTGQRRFEPLMSPAKYGGVFIIWSRGGYIYIRHIGPNGIMGKPEKICEGTKGSICVDRVGNIHIAYNKGKNSIVSYRKIVMSTSISVGAPFRWGNVSAQATYDSKVGLWYIKTLNNQIVSYGQQWGGEGYKQVSGDFDGDGYGDLGTWNTTSCQWYIYSIKKQASLAWNLQWGMIGCIPVPGDYDGDGKDDLAIYDQQRGRWYVRSLAGAVIMSDFQWGYNRAISVPGDFDGDNKSDMAVFDEDNGNWYIYSTLKKNTLVWGGNLGISNCVPISGDFDGDGKHDLAVCSLDSSKWYIKSVDGRIILWDYVWGWKGALAGAGDYDGDGADDLAIFDYLGSIQYGNWYIYSVKKRQVLAWGANWGYKGVTPIGFSVSN